MGLKRKHQTSEKSKITGQQMSQYENSKRQKIDVAGEEETVELLNQDKKPCLDDAQEVPNTSKKQGKRKRDDTCENADSETPEEATERTPKRRRTITDIKDNFTFHRVLGSGNYGQVLLATHNPTDTLVAVKIATKEQIIEDDDEDSFTIERDILELVNESPLFTQLYQCFQTKEHLYYVLQYAGRGTLKDLLESGGSLDTEAIRFYAAEMACAITYLHSKRIIHRDLKPENILIGSDGHLKTADFGLSIILPENSHQTKGRAGTAGYMAPEMVSSKNYSFPIDWFSYGVILYYLATGMEPFDAKTYAAKVRKNKSYSPKYPDDMDSELKDLIQNLLIRKPESRLGAHNIRSHPFFRNMNWADIELCKLDAPSCKNCKEEATTTETINQDLVPEESIRKSSITPSKDELFRNFSFTNSAWRPPD